MEFVTPFMQDHNQWPRHFATLGRLWLPPSFGAACLGGSHLPGLTVPHRTGVAPYTSSYELAGSCVFDKQSKPPGCLRPGPPRGDQPRHRAPLQAPGPGQRTQAPLIPKVRGQFAEFLLSRSPSPLAHLTLAHLSWFGTVHRPRLFLWSETSPESTSKKRPVPITYGSRLRLRDRVF